MARVVKKLRTSAVRIQPEIFAAVFHTEIGWMQLQWEQDRLHYLRFGFRTQREALVDLASATWMQEEHAPPRVLGWIKRLREFANGRFNSVNAIPLDLSHLTEFQQRVVKICRSIPAGETISYGRLATLAGVPGGARAVGNVMRANRFPLIVPCHRVVGANGKLCGFSCPQGVSMKEQLLELEKSQSKKDREKAKQQ